MDKREEKDLVGHPSDYGSRTLAQPDAEHAGARRTREFDEVEQPQRGSLLADEDDRQRTERGEIGRTADGEPREDRGTADSAISREKTGK